MKEQNRREIAEVDLATALKRHENTTQEKKELVELRKENLYLKDKIQRQEAFILKKLNKEKVIRDRNIGVAVTRFPIPVSSRDNTQVRRDPMNSSKLRLPTPPRGKNGTKNSRPFKVLCPKLKLQ
jgi:uncharacterized protein YdcH (DUF465 family)